MPFIGAIDVLLVVFSIKKFSKKTTKKKFGRISSKITVNNQKKTVFTVCYDKKLYTLKTQLFGEHILTFKKAQIYTLLKLFYFRVQRI